MGIPYREAFKDFGLVAIIMALSIAGGVAGWYGVRWAGDRSNGNTDISSQSRIEPSK